MSNITNLFSEDHVEKLAREAYSEWQGVIMFTAEGDPLPVFGNLSENEKKAWKKAILEVLKNLKLEGVLKV